LKWIVTGVDWMVCTWKTTMSLLH